jgi:hypothetical protein
MKENKNNGVMACETENNENNGNNGMAIMA